MSFKFETLIIWQKSMEFGENIHLLSKKFPKNEIINHSSQITRASDSIALNLAERVIGQNKPELFKFIGYSIRSLAEVVTCLYKAKNRKYLTKLVFQIFYKMIST